MRTCGKPCSSSTDPDTPLRLVFSTFVAHVPELDISSCGETEADARRNIVDAVAGFVETAKKAGTLREILEEAGQPNSAADDRW